MTCPKCGNQDDRISRQCPQMDGQAVCIRCCTECCYYDPDPVSIYACRYHICNPQISWDAEIQKIEQQITYTENRIRRLYERNWPKKAELLEVDLAKLIRKKREMKRKQDEENQKAGNAL